MREMWDNPGSKCTSIPSVDNYVSVSVHAVIDVSRLPHADDTYILCPHLFVF